MQERMKEEQLARMLLARLERISADSIWAHRASGIRGALLKIIDSKENALNDDINSKEIIKISFWILERAGKELKK